MESESLGLLKVLVIQGKKLVIRDFKSSDPYVVVKLGNQVISCPAFFYAVHFSFLWTLPCSDVAC